MTPQTITLILLAIALLFLVIGMFWGIVRGFKKSLFRGIWLFVLALIMFFLTPTISKAICNLNIEFLNLSIQGEPVTSIYDAINTLVMSQEKVAEMVESNPDLIPLIEELIVLFINTFMFPILFWLAKIVTYPIWAIISAIVFKKKKIKVDGKKKILKTKKYRFAGLLIGAVSGVMILAVTFMPINGTIKLIKEVDEIEYSGGENGEGIITTMLGKENMEYIDSYSNSILSKALKYTGITYISNSMYNFLSTKKIDDQKVSLTEEVKLYVKLYNDFEVIQKTNFTTIDKLGMSNFLNSSENLIKSLFSSKLIKVAGDDLITYAIDLLEQNETFTNKINSISIDELRELANQAIEELKTSNVSTVQQDLLNAVYICKSLNDNDIMIPLIHNTVEPIEYLNLVTDRVVDEVSKYMFKMPSVNKIYPIAINKGLSYVARILDFAYTETDYSNENLSQQDFANIIKGGLAVARTINFDSEYYVTKSSFEATGQFLDTLKNLNILQNGVFDNIIEKLFDKGVEYLNKQNIDAKLKDLISNVVGKVENLILEKTTLLKDELRQYGVLFDDVKNVVNEFQTTAKDKLILKVYGALLDKLNKTDLFKEVVPDVIDTGWSLIKDQVANALPQLTDINKIFETIKNNLVLILENQNKQNPDISSPSNIQLSLETEFQNLQSLYDFVCDNFLSYFKDGGSGLDGLVNDVFKDDNALMAGLGIELDNSTKNNQLILTNDVVRSVVAQTFKIARDNIITDERMLEFVNDIIYNIETYTVKVTWEHEFEYFKELANTAKSGISLDTIGTVLDSVCESKYIGYTLINELLQEKIQEKYDALPDDIKNTSTADIISAIKTNIGKINSGIYNQEINYLLDLIDLFENFASKSYSEMGTALDGFNSSFTISSVRNSILSYGINKKLEDSTLSSTFRTILETISANVSRIPNRVSNDFYYTEFMALQTLSETSYPTSKDELTESILSDIGLKFYNVSNNYLSYNLGEVVMGIIFDYVEYPDIADVINSIKNTIVGNNGILINNKLNPNLNNETQLVKKANYVGAFTELKELMDIYESVSAISTSKDTDASVIGGYLDEFANLNIITNEDKTIAKMVLDDFSVAIKDEITARKQNKIDEIQESSLTDQQKTELIEKVSEKALEYQNDFESVIVNSKGEVDNKTDEVSYVTIFQSLITNINNLLESIDEEFNSYKTF